MFKQDNAPAHSLQYCAYDSLFKNILAAIPLDHAAEGDDTPPPKRVSQPLTCRIFHVKIEKDIPRVIPLNRGKTLTYGRSRVGAQMQDP